MHCSHCGKGFKASPEAVVVSSVCTPCQKAAGGATGPCEAPEEEGTIAGGDGEPPAPRSTPAKKRRLTVTPRVG